MKIIRESLKSRIIKLYRRLVFSEKTGYMLNLLTMHISDEKVSRDYEEYQVNKVIKGAFMLTLIVICLFI